MNWKKIQLIISIIAAVVAILAGVKALIEVNPVPSGDCAIIIGPDAQVQGDTQSSCIK